jgi:hypothetical protein
MPDAGASRKRQIQVTPGPFIDITAPGAARTSIARIYELPWGLRDPFKKAGLGKPYFTDSPSLLSLLRP